MHTCPPTEFKNRWPGVLRAIKLPTPLPPIPGDCRRLLTEFGLPHALTIYCYNDIHLEFSDLLVPLAEIWSRDVKLGYRMGEMPKEWNRFWHVGDQEYLQGGGWICIEEVSGRLVIIDLDQPDPVYLLNSSVLNFYTTLAYFLDWSEKTDGRPEETVALIKTLLAQNCLPPDELNDFWMNFIDATLDGDPVNLAVRLGPKVV